MDNGAKNARVSVVIPTYNRGRVVTEAVDSVLSQEYGDFELIVVDDGSTDDTRELLGRYGGRLTLLSQENRGVSAARNTGIRASRGELIAFLDSDDTWLPGKLTDQVAFFDENPEALICQTEEIWVRNGKRVNPKKKHRKLSGMIFEPSLALCLVSPSAVMIRRRLLDEVGLFDEELPACEDYDLWLRISRRYPVHLTETPRIVKRGGHEDQLSRAPRLDRFRVRAMEKLLLSGELSPEQERAVRAAVREKSAVYAAGCKKWGREAEALSYLEKVKRWEYGIEKE